MSIGDEALANVLFLHKLLLSLLAARALYARETQ
jgi:hypothetical protein